MERLKTNLFLKTKIIELLNNHVDYISTEQICQEFESYSRSMIRNTCLELQADFEELYTPEEAEFQITKRDGIKLIRRGVNIQRLIENLFTKSMSYDIICKLFLDKEVLTADFCEEHYISKSTLSRKLKQLNLVLNDYDLHITLSEHMSLKGPESRIRLLYQLYFHSVHKDLERLPWYSKEAPYLPLAKQLVDYLKLENYRRTLSDAYLFVHIFCQRVENGYSAEPDDPSLKHVDDYEFIEKPDFLANWTESDWQVFLLVMYTINISSDPIFLQKKTTYIFEKEVQIWLNTCDAQIASLSLEKRPRLGQGLDRQLQFNDILSLSPMLLDMVGMYSLGYFEKDFPDYLIHFETFWESLSQQSEVFANSAYLRAIAMFNWIAYLDLTVFNPRIKLFVHSDVMKLHQSFVQKRINYRLSKYMVDFVASPQEADLIISTVDLSEDDFPEEKVIQICASLPNSDLQMIEDQADRLLDQ